MIIKIINNLYLGDHKAPMEEKFDAILAVLNDQIPYVVPQDAYYLRIPAPDGLDFTEEMCITGVEFIRHQVEFGRKTLVHCWSGISRSICVLSAYMSKYNRKEFDVEVKKMLQCRALIKMHESNLPDQHVFDVCKQWAEPKYIL